MTFSGISFTFPFLSCPCDIHSEPRNKSIHTLGLQKKLKKKKRNKPKHTASCEKGLRRLMIFSVAFSNTACFYLHQAIPATTHGRSKLFQQLSVSFSGISWFVSFLNTCCSLLLFSFFFFDRNTEQQQYVSRVQS